MGLSGDGIVQVAGFLSNLTGRLGENVGRFHRNLDVLRPAADSNSAFFYKQVRQPGIGFSAGNFFYDGAHRSIERQY